MSGERGTSRRGFLRAVAGGTAVTGAAGVATAQEGGGTTHTVEMTDSLVFDPDTITIAPGDTVEWQYVGTIPHTVTAYGDEIPDGATYFASGGFDSEDAARSDWSGSQEGAVAGGESFSHTFETEGTYGYFCIPHEAAGMTGTVEVSADAGKPDGGGGPPPVPDSAKTLGVATTAGMVGTLALAVALLKYGGPTDEE